MVDNNLLLNVVKEEYALTNCTAKQNGPVWKITYAKGLLLLKKMQCTPAQIYWLADIINRLITAGFKGLTPLFHTKKGEPFIIFNNQLYIVTLWHQGKHPIFSSLSDLKKTAALYGKLHKISKIVIQSKKNQSNDYLDLFQHKYLFLKSCISQLKSEPKLNRIDRTIVKWADYFFTQAEISLDGLRNLNISKWSKETDEKGFCHKDPAPRNIIIQGSNWFLIDYELSGIDFFVEELTTLAHRALLANHWEFGLLSEIVETYQIGREISETEKKLIPYLLCFPRQYWRLCSQRYEEKLNWKETHFQSKLWGLLNHEWERNNFLLNWFPEISKTPFGGEE